LFCLFVLFCFGGKIQIDQLTNNFVRSQFVILVI
jgi:hypothetical protein